MEGRAEKGQDQWLLDASLVLLVLYNAVFLWDVMAHGGDGGRWAQATMAFIDARRGWVTLFEAIAALSLFVDLVVRFDHYEGRSRKIRVAAIGIAMTGLIFKAFAFYLDSAYLE